MADQQTERSAPRPDPFAFWARVYEAGEQAWTAAMRDAIAAPSYATLQGKWLDVTLSYQKLLRDLVSAQLASLNVPTRDDVARVGELSVGIEEKVDRLYDGLADLRAQLGQVASLLGDATRRLDELAERLAGTARDADRPAAGGREGAPVSLARARAARGSGRGDRGSGSAAEPQRDSLARMAAEQAEQELFEALAEQEIEHL